MVAIRKYIRFLREIFSESPSKDIKTLLLKRFAVISLAILSNLLPLEALQTLISLSLLIKLIMEPVIAPCSVQI